MFLSVAVLESDQSLDNAIKVHLRKRGLLSTVICYVLVNVVKQAVL